MPICIVLILAAGLSVADTHEEESSSPRTGRGKAVVSASRHDGLELSGAALKRLGIQTTRIPAGATMKVPLSSLVYSQSEVGVYRHRDNHFQLVEVLIVKKDPATAIIRAEGLASGDEIVTSGAAFLRVAELDVLGGHQEGHGH